MNPITNLAISEVNLVDDKTEIVFSFTKPSGNVGGYYLYVSSTGVTYTKVFTRVDATHIYVISDKTYDSGGVTYFEYILPTSYTDGKLLYFTIVTLSTTRVVSIASNVVTAYTYPSKPSNLFVEYNGLTSTLTWDTINFSNNRNSTFLNYNVYRDIAVPINGATYDNTTGLLSNDLFTVGLTVWAVDIFKRVQWRGAVTTAGEFPLDSTTKLIGYSDNSYSYTINIDSLTVFVENNTPDLIGSSSTGYFVDATLLFDRHYIYNVQTSALDSKLSSSVKYQCYTIDTTNAYPYLRPVENSSTGILANPYWRKMKDVLIDKNYYDKTAFAIPFSKDTIYNLKGYLGVSNCKLDTFINGIYYSTTSTGRYGEFDIDYKFTKSNVELSFQARDQLNIKFSRKSAPYSIRVLNAYTWFSIIGDQYDQMTTELDSIRSDVSMETCRYSYFEDKFSPFINLYKQADEDESKFRSIAISAFQAFEYATFDQSLRIVLDAFENNVPEFEHYDIYYNNTLYRPKYTGRTFTCTNPSLPRGDYYYGVSSVSDIGEETAVSKIRLDRRWWPNTYYGANVLMWDYMTGSDSYNIYRGYSSTGLYLLRNVPGNVYVDGNYDTLTSTGALLFNFTDLLEPTNFRASLNVFVTGYIAKRKRKSTFSIVIYTYGNSSIPEINITRIRQLLSKMIPPELKYNILMTNDTTTTIYAGGEIS